VVLLTKRLLPINVNEKIIGNFNCEGVSEKAVGINICFGQNWNHQVLVKRNECGDENSLRA
jgi:hypothetical protein